MSDWRQDYGKFKNGSSLSNIKKYDKNSGMLGKLGEAIKLRFTPQYFRDSYGIVISTGEYTKEEMGLFTGGSFATPVEIAYDVEGEYECVCENGIEIH